MWYYIPFCITKDDTIFGVSEVNSNSLGEAIRIVTEGIKDRYKVNLVTLGYSNMYQSPVKLEKAK